MPGLVDQITRMVAPLQARLRGLIGRGVVRKVNDSRKMQEVQVSVLAKETRDGVEHWQPYGFSSVPPEGAEALLVFPAGDRSHGAAIMTEDRRYRRKGQGEGDVSLYTRDSDLYVHLDDSNGVATISADTIRIEAGIEIVLDVAGTEIKVESGKVTITAAAIELKES